MNVLEFLLLLAKRAMYVLAIVCIAVIAVGDIFGFPLVVRLYTVAFVPILIIALLIEAVEKMLKSYRMRVKLRDY